MEAQRFPDDFDGIVAGAPAQLLDCADGHRGVEKSKHFIKIRPAIYRRPNCKRYKTARLRPVMLSMV